MYIDPEIAPILDFINAAPSTLNAPIEELRAGYSALLRMMSDGQGIVSVEDHVVEGEGHSIAVRVLRPDIDGPLPVIVYFHGGGWTIGDLDAYNGLCSQIADRVGCLVVSVDYRLAPEHKFPAAVEDAVAALEWVASSAGDIGADPDRIAIAGDSAGGNLATVAAIAARDSGGPQLCFQLLLYPSVDMDLGSAASVTENAEGFILTTATMRWFIEQYCPNSDDQADPRASPLRNTDLSRLPHAYIVTASLDPLRDQGLAYVKALEAADSAVTHMAADGLPHLFLHFHRQVAEAERLLAAVCTQARAAFA